ncbi:MAG: type II toxin-antitoxin system VapC family toxin [Chloroflexota bacterium]|nr:type II toxin-antitoxin system VapC family toxin [Chloroflexota bacterium]
MKVSAALANVAILAVETSPFIYFIEKHPQYLNQTRAIFSYVSQGAVAVNTSVMTLTEVLTLPLAKNLQHYVTDYQAMLLNTNGITTISVNVAIARRAAELRARYGLRTPDALHLATAIETRCDAFLTNDHALTRVREITVLVLGNLTL